MPELLTGLGLLLLGGLLSLGRWRWPGFLGGMTGLALLLAGAAQELLTHHQPRATLDWTLPAPPVDLVLDDLSAFFLLASAGLGMVAFLYARSYFGERPPWFFLNLMLGSLAFVLLCRSTLAFLIAWEVMALAAFFLVTRDDEQREVRRAGWIYLAATHLGTFFLMGCFVALGPELTANGVPEHASAVFWLALIGFGTKAGLVPVHVWLPEAHPVAPSPVSALMSGVMINMGLYGLLRVLSCLGPAPSSWGWALLVVGSLSALGGVLFALAQRNLKQMLAYSSVENMGLVAIGLGLGLLGYPLGTAVAMLHILAHGVLKTLLFLGAGAVLHQAHTCDIERTGGLLRRMPVTGLTFLLGAAGLAGLPPLNGFVTEFLLLVTSLEAIRSSAPLPGLFALGSVGLVAGLSLALFSKAFGIVFLGEPRSTQAERAVDPPAGMLAPMVLLCLTAIALTAASPWLLEHLGADLGAGLTGCLQAFALLGGLAGALFGLRVLLLQGRPQASEPTWDCGYRAATARMEYTGLSYSQPLTDLFGSLLHHRVRQGRIQGIFPSETSFSDSTPDLLEDEVYLPLLRAGERLAHALRRIQHGRVQAYILYILVTLAGLLAWSAR